MKIEKKPILIQAIKDYFGEKVPYGSFNRCLSYLMDKKEIELNEEERDAVWYIKQNLKDRIYRRDILLRLKNKKFGKILREN